MKEIPKSSRFKRSTNVLYKLIAIYYENKRYARYPRFKVFRENHNHWLAINLFPVRRKVSDRLQEKLERGLKKVQSE